MKKKFSIGIAIFVVLMVIFIFFRFKAGTHKNKYEVAVVDRGDIIEKITATGTINPVVNVRVGSQVSGRIAKIYADYNAQVKKGEVIAQLETDIYQTKVEQAAANLNLAQAQTQEAEAAFFDAKNNLKRIKNLQKGRVSSERDLEIAETKYKSTKAVLYAARARQRQALALLNSAKLDLEHTTIHSPVDGTVISRNCDVGQTVVATFQTPDLFIIAQDLTKMQVEANVDEADIGKINVGQKVLFTVDAYPERTFHGIISQVRFAPKEEQNVVTYATVIEVSNQDLALRPGMTATVSIIASEKRSVLRVPNIALRFKADPKDRQLLHKDREKNQDITEETEATNSRQGLWILDEAGKPHYIQVKTGVSDGRYTEILSGPMHKGVKVIVGYLSKWKQGKASKGTGLRFGFKRK